MTASIAAKALAVFEKRASEHEECRDTFRVAELWTEAMEQARQTIDLLKPEFSMCHSFVGCEGASILSEGMPRMPPTSSPPAPCVLLSLKYHSTIYLCLMSQG